VELEGTPQTLLGLVLMLSARGQAG
jgi:hypothetical protein